MSFPVFSSIFRSNSSAALLKYACNLGLFFKINAKPAAPANTPTKNVIIVYNVYSVRCKYSKSIRAVIRDFLYIVRRPVVFSYLCTLLSTSSDLLIVQTKTPRMIPMYVPYFIKLPLLIHLY